MSKHFSVRRVPRKIGTDDDEPMNVSGNSGAEAPGSPVTRPKAKFRKASNLRKAFGPSIKDDDEDEEGSSGVVTPKRSALSKVAIQRNASQKRSALLAQSLPRRRRDEGEEDGEDDAPDYSAASLQELKNSTPSTPQDASNISAENTDGEGQTLDLSSKFGTNLARYDPLYGQSSAIPSEAEIAEKKARRARLAQEQKAEEYISLDPDDPDLDDEENTMHDELGRLVLKPKDRWGEQESRLVRDDEDIMENFDDFTNESGQVPLGQRAEREAEMKRRTDMAQQIAAAEGQSDASNSGDESEKERSAAFEAAQTRHGTYASKSTNAAEAERLERPRTPPRISPIPTLDGVLDRLRKQVTEMQSSRMQRQQEMEALRREKLRLAEEEVRIQKALKETAAKFEQLRAEKGITGNAASADVSAQASAIATREGTPMLVTDRKGGLPTNGFGEDTAMMSGALGASRDADSDEDDYDNDDDIPRGGLGLGMGGQNLEGFLR